MSSASKQLTARIFGEATPREREIGLTILRVVVGAIFVAHGAQKFFLLGLPTIVEGFTQVGIPIPSVMAPGIALIELLGGIALIAGLLTRPAALGTAFTMLGALFFVHLKLGFFLPNGFEYALALLAASVAIILMGPGSFSLDALLARRAESTIPLLARAERRRVA